MKNPYKNDKWLKDAFDAASDQFDLICWRLARETFPIKECSHPSDQWEFCLGHCFNAPPEQNILYKKLIKTYSDMAYKAISGNMYEPCDSYFGTYSCWQNAALRGLEGIRDKIVVRDDMLVG